MNYIKELKKFREKNTDLSYKEAQIQFKEIWKELKKAQKESQNSGDTPSSEYLNLSNSSYTEKVNEEKTLEEEAIEFYNNEMAGRTHFRSYKIKEDFFNLYRKICNKTVGDKNCSGCIQKLVKEFKYQLNIK